MRDYIVFLKKEIRENIRTNKWMILSIVFAILGMLNPLTAKLTPQILKTILPEGSPIPLPEPSALDSWAQFFKNINQMGIIVILLVFSGILFNELSKGTLVNILTKGLPRKVVILSKYTLMLLTWTFCLALSFLITWVYTAYLFPAVDIHHLFYSIFCLWLYGAFLLSVLIFSSTIMNNSYGNLIIVGLTLVLGMLANLVPSIQQYNPMTSSSRNMELLNGALEPSYFFPSIAVTLMLTIILLFLSVLILNKRQVN